MGLGLPTWFAAAIHGLLSVGLAWVLLRGFTDTAIRNNLLVFAACTSVFVHMVPSPALLLLGYTFAIVLARPKQQNHVPALYFGYLLLFPHHIFYVIPFPGLDHLITYAWWLPLAVLYLPRAPRRQDIEWNSVDVFFALFVLLIAVLDFRENTITNGLRSAFLTTTYLFVPYWFLRRAFRSHDDLAVFLRGVFVTAVILGCFALISQLRHWDFMSGPHFVEYRAGFMRLGVTLSTGLMGLVCGSGLVLLLYRQRKLGLRPLWTFVTIFVLALAVLSSGARVAVASTALLGLLLVFYRFITPRRLIGATAIFVLGFGVIMERLVTMEMGVMDEHGTFVWRQRVLAATIAAVGESPVWGNIHFLESRYLQPLDHGQEVIDIVNRYAQIALQYGLIALSFFVLAHGMAIFKAVQYWASPAISDGGGRVASTDIKFIVASSIVYMFFIGTLSHTSHVALFGVILLAILRACTSIGQQEERRTRKGSPAARFS